MSDGRASDRKGETGRAVLITERFLDDGAMMEFIKLKLFTNRRGVLW